MGRIVTYSGENFWNLLPDDPSGLTTENVIITQATSYYFRIALKIGDREISLGNYDFRGSFQISGDVIGKNIVETSGLISGIITSEAQEFGDISTLITYASPVDLTAFQVSQTIDDTLESLTRDYAGDDVFTTDSSQYDVIHGYAGNDTYNVNQGGDFFNGGSGLDRAVVNAPYSALASLTLKTDISDPYSGEPLTGYVGIDVEGNRVTLVDVERINFNDTSIALDTEGATSAGGIYRLYQATFARTPDKEGYGFWLAAADNGLSAKRMAEDFTMSAEFQSLYGVNTTDPYFTGEDVGAMITGFYNNILGRDPDPSGYDFWVGVVENKIDTVGGVLTGFSESAENYNNTIGTIQNGMEYDLWV